MTDRDLPDTCPDCGEDIPEDYFELLRKHEGGFLPAEKVCIIDFPQLLVIHFDDGVGEAPLQEANR